MSRRLVVLKLGPRGLSLALGLPADHFELCAFQKPIAKAGLRKDLRLAKFFSVSGLARCSSLIIRLPEMASWQTSLVVLFWFRAWSGRGKLFSERSERALKRGLLVRCRFSPRRISSMRAQETRLAVHTPQQGCKREENVGILDKL